MRELGTDGLELHREVAGGPAIEGGGGNVDAMALGELLALHQEATYLQEAGKSLSEE